MFGTFWRLPVSRIFAVLVLDAFCPTWSQVPIDACTLLTSTEVSTALGAMAGPGTGLVQHVCSWHVSGTPKGATLVIYPLKRFTFLKQNTVAYPVAGVSLEGVGDEAVFGVLPDFAGTLLVRKGNFVFMVRVEGFGFDKNNSVPREVEVMEKTLAELVLSKL